ncbi:hypothetical protein N6G02_09275 [Cupriavidus gilardii]|uniref:DUF6602 domain-containing protein n=1 Tax=Cupriavidus gilardii TaxID=82541 RepID=UPI0021C179E1|nr:DUF6602 domain-containing protein [Cupriavidus gilardii]MCT9116313.1 hypothetical protein [Cupriavidus gilardii]
MKPMIEYCQGAVKALTAQFEMSKVLGHAATAGSARERLIVDFLTAHLPEMTSVVSGVIVDFEGTRSKQQDIVLMLKSMPRLPFSSGHDLIFLEGAVATFEIKTNIQPSELPEIAANIESVKRLKATSMGGTKIGVLNWPWPRIFHAIVTYDGASLKSIAEKFNDLPEAGWPDVYMDLSKGILIRNEGILIPKSGTDGFYCIDDATSGLAHFLTQLTIVTSNLSVRDVEWQQYMG